MSLTEEKGRELVLCVDDDDVHRLFGSQEKPWLPVRDETEVDVWLAKATVAFLPRSIAEDDPSWRHACTYSVLRDGDRIFTYRRGASGSEGRLHGKLSLGVGGHVGIEDYDVEDGISTSMISYAVFREIGEEMNAGPMRDARMVGLIADDSSPVNRVHVGAVHTVRVLADQVRPREDCLADPQWLTAAELRERRGEFESWSQICIDRLLTSDGGRS